MLFFLLAGLFLVSSCNYYCCGEREQAGPPPPPPPEHPIPFVSDQNGAFYDIFVMEADGSNQQLLRDTEYPTRALDFSEDAARIAYIDVDGNQDITRLWVMDGNADNLRLLDDAYHFSEVGISGDGSRIAYNFDPGNRSLGLIGVASDGTDSHRILDTEEYNYNFSPRLNYDGSRIVYKYRYEHPPQSRPVVQSDAGIYQINWDGSNEELLVRDDDYIGMCASPMYSRDETHLYYVWGTWEPWENQIRVLDLDNPLDPPEILYTAGESSISSLHFSYDYSRLIFSNYWGNRNSERSFNLFELSGLKMDPQFQIYSIDAATGGDLQQLTGSDYNSYFQYNDYIFERGK